MGQRRDGPPSAFPAAGAAARRDAVGVLGGMGPLATVDFMRKVIAHTPAEADADHIPLIVSSIPQIPDRVGPILRGEGADPLPALVRERRLLEAAGAKCLVMPCNTAHHWYEPLAEDCPIPFLHVVDATRDSLAAAGVGPGPLGLVGTEATQKSRFFQDRLGRVGYDCRLLDAAAMDRWIEPGIRLVKQYRLEEAAGLLRRGLETLLAGSVSKVVLACTEIPAAFPRRRPLCPDILPRRHRSPRQGDRGLGHGRACRDLQRLLNPLPSMKAPRFLRWVWFSPPSLRAECSDQP